MERTVFCADYFCEYNSGGGCYGICQHPTVTQPMYTGGIDRTYLSTCKLRETKIVENSLFHKRHQREERK